MIYIKYQADNKSCNKFGFLVIITWELIPPPEHPLSPAPTNRDQAVLGIPGSSLPLPPPRLFLVNLTLPLPDCVPISTAVHSPLHSPHSDPTQSLPHVSNRLLALLLPGLYSVSSLWLLCHNPFLHSTLFPPVSCIPRQGLTKLLTWPVWAQTCNLPASASQRPVITGERGARLSPGCPNLHDLSPAVSLHLSSLSLPFRAATQANLFPSSAFLISFFCGRCFLHLGFCSCCFIFLVYV